MPWIIIEPQKNQAYATRMHVKHEVKHTTHRLQHFCKWAIYQDAKDNRWFTWNILRAPNWNILRVPLGFFNNQSKSYKNLTTQY